MRGIVALIFVLLAVMLFLGSMTMNWPSSPNDWSHVSYEVGWERYAIAVAMAIVALLIYWWPAISQTYHTYCVLKQSGGGADYQRLINQGIGRRENKRRKNPWPKRQLE